MKNIPGNIIISRTDSIGDVVLTLPVAKVLKEHFPGMKIAFLGRSYTRAVIEACKYVDEFIELHDFLERDITIAGERPEAILHVFPVKEIAQRAKKTGIQLRIGTTNRLYHWTSCNKLIKLSRRKSDLHEAQLNIKLLSVFGINTEYSLEALGADFGLERAALLQAQYLRLLEPGKYHLILHPKSQGSAREWGLDHFAQLIRIADRSRIQLFVSGTEKEKVLLQPLLDQAGDMVTDISGLMPLEQFIAFIQHCDGLVANSTGPLHIAAASGKDAYGIYPPMRPIHPGRWAPLGSNAQVFVMDRNCEDCRKQPTACHCIREILPEVIIAAIRKNAG